MVQTLRFVFWHAQSPRDKQRHQLNSGLSQVKHLKNGLLCTPANATG